MIRPKVKVGDYIQFNIPYHTYDDNCDHYIEEYESSKIKLAQVIQVTSKGTPKLIKILVCDDVLPSSTLCRNYEQKCSNFVTDIGSYDYTYEGYSEIYSKVSSIIAKKLMSDNIQSLSVKSKDGNVDVTLKANDINLRGTEELINAFNAIGEKLSSLTAQITNNQKIDKNSNETLQQAIIEGIIDKAKDIASEDICKEISIKVEDYIKNEFGLIPKRLEIKVNEKEPVTITGLTHKMFDKVLKLVEMKLPVFIEGPAGTGKNFMVGQIAEALHLPFFYTSSITQEYKLTGFIDGGGTYHETEFYKAFKNGGLLMIDEMDACVSDVLVQLNGAIANGYYDFPNGRINAHPDFRLITAGNTVGYGSDAIYTGRNVIDGATLDRFVLVHMDYDKEVEEALCPDSSFRSFVYEVRQAVKDLGLPYVVGMRCLKNGYALLDADFDKSFILSSTVFKGYPKDDIEMIKNKLGSGEWKNAM